ncbi:MAG TPA: hypothetical protein VFB95_07485 [Candidatus Cryosericum sp.]|nr:hypothetical protein [Candidatus Cryosericum sp.]
MSRRSVVQTTATAVLLAVLPAACGPAPADPALDRVRLVTDGPEATSAVAAMLQAYGGTEAWDRMANVEYRYTLSFYGGQPAPVRLTHQLQRLGLGEEPQVYIEDIDGPERQIARLDGAAFSLMQDGAPVGDSSQIEFRETYARIVRWSFLMPWILLDPASRLESRGVRTPQTAGPVPAGPCDVVRLRFERPTDGGGTDDWHDIYISRLSRLIEQVHSYRAQPNDFRLSVWSDHQNFGGIRVATRRRTYASDAGGAIGKLEAVDEYDDIHFDAPFDASIFHAPAAGTATADDPTAGAPGGTPQDDPPKDSAPDTIPAR